MLKVVGASFYKTKVSSLIILVALLLAIGALFILKLERPVLENVYCATSYYTPSTGYRVEFWGQGHHLEEIPRGVSRICYKSASEDVVEWPHMEIESNPTAPDNIQAYGSGILEGSLLWKSLYLQWTNTVQEPCTSDLNSAKFCQWLRKTVSDNYHSLKEQINGKLKTQMDSYWYQIHLYYLQLEGIDFGWRIGLKRSSMKRSGIEIPFTDILILNLGADLKLLENYYNAFVNPEAPVKFAQRHTQTIRLDVKSEEGRINLSMDHQVIDDSTMAHRVLKKYKLNYRISPTVRSANAIVPGQDIVFTSSAGVVASADDFYAITGRHARITIAGVDLKYSTEALQRETELLQVVPLPARVMAANRLAISTRTWAKLMKRDPYGARQWVVIDRRVMHRYNNAVMDAKQSELVEAFLEGGVVEKEPNQNNVNNNLPLEKLEGLIWIVDNAISRLHGEDVTERMLQSGKAVIDGTPRFKETQKESGLSNDEPSYEQLKQVPEEFSFAVRFFAIAPGRSEYLEGMTVIHGGEEMVAAATDQLEGDVEGEPAWSMSGSASKWTWV